MSEGSAAFVGLVIATTGLTLALSSDAVETIADELGRNLREAVPAVEHVFLDPTRRR